MTEPRIAHPRVGLFLRLRHTMIASYNETTGPDILGTFRSDCMRRALSITVRSRET